MDVDLVARFTKAEYDLDQFANAGRLIVQYSTTPTAARRGVRASRPRTGNVTGREEAISLVASISISVSCATKHSTRQKSNDPSQSGLNDSEWGMTEGSHRPSREVIRGAVGLEAISADWNGVSREHAQ